MKHIKLLLVIGVLISTAIASSIVNAATAGLNLQLDVDSVAEISTCGSISFPSNFTANNGQTTSGCTISAYSNNPTGFYIELDGSDLSHTILGDAWDDLLTTTGGMDTSCTSSCTEAWGWRIVNGTASEYDTVETDSDNEATSFDSNATTCGSDNDEPCWHTVNDSAASEQIITNTNDIANTAEFDVEFGAVTDVDTLAGTYQSTITVTITMT